MLKFTRRRIDSSVEEKIVTAAIMSDAFLKQIYTIYDPAYLKSPFAQRVMKWAIEYYESYEKAPKNHIKDIYDIEKNKIEEAEEKIIAAFLTKLSQQYEMETQEINDDYYVDTALKYFELRELEITSGNVQKLIEVGKIDEAKEQFENYKKVVRQTSGWYNPFDKKNIIATFEDSNEILFSFPGQLGEMIGGFERGWLFSVVGKFKGGKSFLLQEIAVQALLKRLKVVYVSLEMKRRNLDKRLYRRLCAMAEGDRNFIYPAFDCEKNQSGECKKPERKNRIRLLTDDDEIPEFDPESDYKPCCVCRKTNPKEYEFATWFESIKRPPISVSAIVKKTNSFKQMFGSNNLRVKTYPRFSASISDIKRDIDTLEVVEGFVADVIIIDYAQIIKPEGKFGKEYEGYDIIWKQLSGLAEERHCLVATGSQVERGTITKAQIEQDGLAGWVGQLAHVDLMFALNQTKEEKRNKLIRVNMLVHREREIDEDTSCVLLQQLELAQPALDSELVRYKARQSSK